MQAIFVEVEVQAVDARDSQECKEEDDRCGVHAARICNAWSTRASSMNGWELWLVFFRVVTSSYAVSERYSTVSRRFTTDAKLTSMPHEAPLRLSRRISAAFWQDAVPTKTQLGGGAVHSGDLCHSCAPRVGQHGRCISATASQARIPASGVAYLGSTLTVTGLSRGERNGGIFAHDFFDEGFTCV